MPDEASSGQDDEDEGDDDEDGQAEEVVGEMSTETLCKPFDMSEVALFDPLSGPIGTDSGMTKTDLETSSNEYLLSAIVMENCIVDNPQGCDVHEADELFSRSAYKHFSEPANKDFPDGDDNWNSSNTNTADSGGLREQMDLMASGRLRTGSIVESGKGDLTMSPVHLAPTSADRPPAVSLSAGSTPKHSGMDGSHRSWSGTMKARLPKVNSLNSCTLTGSGGMDKVAYILEAAEQIGQAQEHEMAGRYQQAFSQYRCGVGMLLKGVQSEYMVSYLLRHINAVMSMVSIYC